MPPARKLTKRQETTLARLLEQGMPRSKIAEALKIPTSTLADILRRRAAQATAEAPATAQAVADEVDEDYRADEEPPAAQAPKRRSRKRATTPEVPTPIDDEVDNMPLTPVAEALTAVGASVDTGTPGVDPEIHEDLTAECPPEVGEGIHLADMKALPLETAPMAAGPHMVDTSGHVVTMGTLSPEVAAFVTEALPALQSLVAWWQERQRLAEQASTPERQLIRQTYHVEKRFVGLIKQEADLRRTTYAHVLNDALTQYFLGHRP